MLRLLRSLHFQFWCWLGRRRSTGPVRFEAIIVKVDRIGDFVLARNAIALLVQKFGAGRCALVISPWAQALAEREFPDVAKIIIPGFLRHKRAIPGWWRVRSFLGGWECGHLISLRHQRWDYDDLVLRWIKAERTHSLEDPAALPMVVGRRTGKFLRPLTRSVEAQPDLCRELLLHQILTSEVLARAVSTEEIKPSMLGYDVVSGDQSAEVIVAPFASISLRDLPTQVVADAVKAVDGIPAICVIGAPDQQSACEKYASQLRSLGMEVASVRQPPDIGHLVDLLAQARLIITTDSAVAHIATALDRPLVVAIGGGTFGQFAPWSRSPLQRWIFHPMSCFNCGWKCIYAEPYCITRISSAQLLGGIREALSSA